MGLFSTLQDVRTDIERHCPPETLSDFDRAYARVCEWETEERRRFGVGLWVGAICGGAFFAILSATLTTAVIYSH